MSRDHRTFSDASAMPKPNEILPDRQYWDASVFCAYISNEEGRADVVGELLEACRGERIEIWTSQFSVVEVAQEATERTQKRLSSDAEERIDSLWLPPTNIRIVEISELVARDARSLVRALIPDGLALRSADAVHLATAMRIQPRLDRIYCYDNWPRYQEMIGIPISEPASLPKPPKSQGLFDDARGDAT